MKHSLSNSKNFKSPDAFTSNEHSEHSGTVPLDIDPIVQNSNSYDQQKSMRPTIECTAEILFAADRINTVCFNGRLPEFVVSYMQGNNTPSHFQPNRFQRADGGLFHGLAFNSTLLGIRSQRDSLITVGYELTRLARYDFGPPNQSGGKGANGYHDKPWAMLAESIGLQPTDTGLPNGKTTGPKMSYFLIDGGKLDTAIQELLDSGFRINWHDRLVFKNSGAVEDIDDDDAPAPKKNRVKFTCPNETCGLNAWMRPTGKLKCGFCDLPMHSPETTATDLTTTKHKDDHHDND